MRVLILTPDIYTRGGIARYTATLATAMADLTGPANVQVLPLLGVAGGNEKLPPCGVFNPIAGRLSAAAKFRFAWKALRLGLGRYHLVIATHLGISPVAGMMRALYGTPFWMVCHGSEAWGRFPADVRWAARRAELLLPVSRFTAERVAMVNGIPTDRMRVLYNAIPDDFAGRLMAPDGADGHAASGRRERRILSVGTVSRECAYKGYDTVIRALPEVLRAFPNARYVVAGEGDDIGRLKQLARETGVGERVEFTGGIPDAQLAALYRSCEVFALPSRMAPLNGKGWQGEGFGRVYVEAALAEKPVLGSTGGGAAEAVLHEKTGLLVDPESVPEVAGGLIRLLGVPELAARMGREGRRWALENFTMGGLRGCLAGELRQFHAWRGGGSHGGGALAAGVERRGSVKGWDAPTMKVVINAASAKMGGAATYIASLLRQLPAEGGGAEFLVFLPPETAARLERPGPNIRLVHTKIGHAGTLRRFWWEQVTLRRLLKKEKAGALFSTAGFAMFFCPVRQLLLVTNSLYTSKTYRERFLPRHSLAFRLAFALRRRLATGSARAADVVMTPTRAMLDELRRSVELKTAVVNPYGVEAPKLHRKTLDEAARRSEGMGNRAVRLLYVSLYGEHKNLTTLLEALEILNARVGTKFKLTTTADPSWPGGAWTVTQREDIRLARRPGIAEWVEFAGPFSAEDVAALYAAADIFVFLSLAETFGFPMAEAMHHGLPIVAADTPVNREVCGRAAVYFNPLSAGDLAGRLQGLAADSELRQRLGAMGRGESAARFRWSAHARRMMEAAGRPRTNTSRSYTNATPSVAGVDPAKAPVSVLVLTRNEEANIAACLKSVRWADEVFVVDSFSTDSTVVIAEGLGAKASVHRFQGYAAQRNWALGHLPFSNEWVLMLDADERVPAALAAEIARLARDPANGHAGFYLKFRHIFLGRWLKHGGLYPTWVLRFFRRQRVRFEERPLNEHAILDGSAGYLQQPFDHLDRKPLADWVARHNRYAGLEADEFLQETLAGGYDSSIRIRFRGSQAERKRWIKLKVWNRLPLLARPFLFFFRNYFLKLGFLDGRAGLVYHVLWSFWYPFLVSARILEGRYEGRRSAERQWGLPEKLPPAVSAAPAQEEYGRRTSASSGDPNGGFYHRVL
jgi:glycosyltransferase involved in cell wall biosynthesis